MSATDATRPTLVPSRALAALAIVMIVSLLEPRATAAALRRTGQGLTDRAATAASGCDVSGWRSIALPDARRSIGMDVAALGGRVAWVVGIRAGRGIPRRPWVVRRTSGGWRSLAIPSVGSEAGLVAVDARSGRDAWAVGYRSVGRLLRPLALRWTGSRWVVASPASPSSGTVALTDVTAGAGTWAVGYRTSGTGQKPYAVQRRSGRWVRRDPPIGSGRFGALTAVAVARGGLWVAGWVSDGTAIRPLLLRRTSSGWQRQSLPGTFDRETVLTSLTTREGALWAAGYDTDGTTFRPVIFRRDTVGWTRVDAATGPVSMLPDDMALSGGMPFLVGSGRHATGGNLVNAVARVVDGTAAVTRRPAGIRGNSHLRSAAIDRGRVFAVGWTDGRAVAIRRCASGAQRARQDRSRASMDAGTGLLATLEGPQSPLDPDRQAATTENATPDRAVGAGGSRRAAAASGVRFRDVARRVGLGMVTPTYGAVAADLDGDGWDDLVISRHQQRGRVLLNRRGRFRPAPSDPLRVTDRHGCGAADLDGDGDDEVICAVGASGGVKLKTNELLLRPLAANPPNAAWPMGVADPLGRGRRAAAVQVDGDRVPELLITNDPLRVDGLPGVNRLYQVGPGSDARPARGLGLDLPIGGACASSAQLDGAGADEVVICTDEPWHGRAGLHVFRRRDGTFVDATRALGLSSANDVDAVVADFDGDGRPDIAQLSGSRLIVSLQRGGRLRRAASIGVQAGRAIAAGDVDRDRRPDLYVVQGGSPNRPDLVLINGGSGRRWRRVAVPSVRSGGADDVVAIDHDRNGRTEFLVLNGNPSAGPVQLIAAFPRRG